MRPAHHALPVALALVLLPVGVSTAAEGVLPIRAGDRVEGVVRYCGDRHVLRVDLTRGERFRLKVGVTKTYLEDISVRIYDPTGLLVNDVARVRTRNGTTLAGPFRVRTSGAHLVQITTFTRHEIPYEARTKVRGRRKRAVRLRGGRERGFVAAAGSVIRLAGADDGSTVTLTSPSGRTVEIAPGSAALDALLGDGMTLPTGGRHRIAVEDGRRRPRVRIAAPRRRDARTLAFPDLPDDRGAVAAWYDETGWTADPTQRAPADHEPPTTRPEGPRPPVTAAPPLATSPVAPADPGARDGFADSGAAAGIDAGIGMPLAPWPTLEDALALGTVEAFGDGPSYVYETHHEELGALRYRVHFVVGGRATLAPVALDGLVAMRWTVEGLDVFHDEAWTLTHDDARGVEVLQGAATRVTGGLTTVRTVSSGFTTPLDGSAPRGSITWGVDSPAAGSFSRTESHDGTGAVTIDVR